MTTEYSARNISHCFNNWFFYFFPQSKNRCKTVVQIIHFVAKIHFGHFWSNHWISDLTVIFWTATRKHRLALIFLCSFWRFLCDLWMKTAVTTPWRRDDDGDDDDDRAWQRREMTRRSITRVFSVTWKSCRRDVEGDDGYASYMYMAGATADSHRVSSGARQSSLIVDQLQRLLLAGDVAAAEFVTSSPPATSSCSTWHRPPCWSSTMPPRPRARGVFDARHFLCFLTTPPAAWPVVYTLITRTDRPTKSMRYSL